MYLFFHFDQASHHARVVRTFSISFGTFTDYLVNSTIWMKKGLILKGKTDGFDQIWWSFMMQKKKAFLCNWCVIDVAPGGTRWCDVGAFGWIKELVWCGRMGCMHYGMEARTQCRQGRCISPRIPKCIMLYVFLTYIFFNHASFPAHPTGGALPLRLHQCGQAPGTGRPLPSQLNKATWHDSSTHKDIAGAPFCFGILSFSNVKQYYSKPLKYIFSHV